MARDRSWALRWPCFELHVSKCYKWVFRIACFEFNSGIPFTKVKLPKKKVEVLGGSEGWSTFISLDSFFIKVDHCGANSLFLGLPLIFLQWASI